MTVDTFFFVLAVHQLLRFRDSPTFRLGDKNMLHLFLLLLNMQFFFNVDRAPSLTTAVTQSAC